MGLVVSIQSSPALYISSKFHDRSLYLKLYKTMISKGRIGNVSIMGEIIQNHSQSFEGRLTLILLNHD